MKASTAKKSPHSEQKQNNKQHQKTTEERTPVTYIHGYVPWHNGQPTTQQHAFPFVSEDLIQQRKSQQQRQYEFHQRIQAQLYSGPVATTTQQEQHKTQSPESLQLTETDLSNSHKKQSIPAAKDSLHQPLKAPPLRIVGENSVAEQQVEQALQLTQPAQFRAYVKRTHAQNATSHQEGVPVSVAWQQAWKRQRRHGQRLSGTLLQTYETFLGRRIAPVYVHQGAQTTALCQQIEADAFTVGRHIFLGRSLRPKRRNSPTTPLLVASHTETNLKPEIHKPLNESVLESDPLLLHELLHILWHTGGLRDQHLIYRRRTRQGAQLHRKKNQKKRTRYQEFSLKNPPIGRLQISWDTLVFIPKEPVLLERGVDLVKVFASVFTKALVPKHYDQKVLRAVLRYLKKVKFVVSSKLLFRKKKQIFKQNFEIDAQTAEGLVIFLEKHLNLARESLQIPGISRGQLSLASASNKLYELLMSQKKEIRNKYVPLWFTQTLFANFISRQGDALQRFQFYWQETLKDKEASKELQLFLQSQIYQPLLDEFTVIFRVRTDPALVYHPIYLLIFGAKSPKAILTILKERNQQAYHKVMHLPVDTNVMNKFMHFIHMQPGLRKKILAGQNTAQHRGHTIASVRHELLERFGRAYVGDRYRFTKDRRDFTNPTANYYTESPYPMRLQSFPKLHAPYFDTMLERPVHAQASIHFPDVFTALNRGSLIWERIKVRSVPNTEAVQQALLHEQLEQQANQQIPKKGSAADKKRQLNAYRQYLQLYHQMKDAGRSSHLKGEEPGFSEVMWQDMTQRLEFLIRDLKTVQDSFETKETDKKTKQANTHPKAVVPTAVKQARQTKALMKTLQQHSERTLSIDESLAVQKSIDPETSKMLEGLYYGVVTLDHFARAIGSALLALLNRMFRQDDERQITFPSPGLYVLRTTLMTKAHEMDEKRRPPSIAVMPVYVHSAHTMARMRVAFVQKQRLQRQRQRQREQEELEKRLKLYAKKSHLNAHMRFLFEQARTQLNMTRGPAPKNTYERLSHQKQKLLWMLKDIDYRWKNSSQHMTLLFLDRRRKHFQEVLQKVNAQLKDYETHIQDRTRVTEVQAIAMGLESGVTLHLFLDLLQQKPEPQVTSHSMSSTSQPEVMYQFRAHDFSGPRVKKQDGVAHTSRRQAMISAVKHLLEYSEYERSQVTLVFSESSGMKPAGPFRTDPKGKRILFQALETASTVATMSLMVAAALSGATAPMMLLIPTGMVGAVPSGFRLADSVQQKTFKWDIQSAIEIADLLGALGTAGMLVGKWGRGASQLAKLHAQTQTSLARTGGTRWGARLAKSKSMAFGALHKGFGLVQGGAWFFGVGGDTASLLFLGKSTIDQLKHIDPSWPASYRRAYVLQILSNAALMAGMHGAGFLARHAIAMQGSIGDGRKLLKQTRKEAKLLKNDGKEVAKQPKQEDNEPQLHQDPVLSKSQETAQELFSYDLDAYRKKVGLVQDGVAKQFEAQLQRHLLDAAGGKDLSPDARHMRQIKVYRASDPSRRGQTMEPGEVRVVHRTNKHGAVTHLEVHVGEAATWANVEAHLGTIQKLLQKSGTWAKWKHWAMDRIGIEPSLDLRRRRGELIAELHKHRKLLEKATSESERNWLKDKIAFYQKELRSKEPKVPLGYIASENDKLKTKIDYKEFGNLKGDSSDWSGRLEQSVQRLEEAHRTMTSQERSLSDLPDDAHNSLKHFYLHELDPGEEIVFLRSLKELIEEHGQDPRLLVVKKAVKSDDWIFFFVDHSRYQEMVTTFGRNSAAGQYFLGLQEAFIWRNPEHLRLPFSPARAPQHLAALAISYPHALPGYRWEEIKTKPGIYKHTRVRRNFELNRLKELGSRIASGEAEEQIYARVPHDLQDSPHLEITRNNDGKPRFNGRWVESEDNMTNFASGSSILKALQHVTDFPFTADKTSLVTRTSDGQRISPTILGRFGKWLNLLFDIGTQFEGSRVDIDMVIRKLEEKHGRETAPTLLEKQTSEASIRKTVRDLFYEPFLERLFSEEYLNSTADFKASEHGVKKASYKQLLSWARDKVLGSKYMGTLFENWFARFGFGTDEGGPVRREVKVDGKEVLVSLKEPDTGKDVDVKRIAIQAFDTDGNQVTLYLEGGRRIDILRNGQIFEVKSGTKALSSDELAQFRDFLRLMGHQLEIDGTKIEMEGLTYVFVNPEGAKANLDFIFEQMTHATSEDILLSFEIFNMNGDSKTISSTDFRLVENQKQAVMEWITNGKAWPAS